MKFVSVNIETHKHHETVMALLQKEKPDVVCLQELCEEDVQKYKELLNYEVIFKTMGFPYSRHTGILKTKKFGVAIFVKNIENYGFGYYVGNEENAYKTYEEVLADLSIKENAVFVYVDTKNDKGESFRFVTTHIPVTDEGEATPKQLAEVDRLLEKLEPLGEIVLAGDMNAPRGRASFSKIANKYKDNIPPEYKTSLDPNLHIIPKGIYYVVDGLFSTPSYKASNVKLVDGVSDHMAIVADIEKE